MSWYRPQEWISVPDRLFFRSHRGRCGCPRPRLLVRRGEGRFPCTAPRPPRRPALPLHRPPPPRAPLRPPSPTRLPHSLHLPCTAPRFPCTALRPPSPPFPAPVPTPSPRHLPPLPANLPKPSDPCHIFFSFFYIFCHNFGDSAPEIPKSASLFCVFMQFDQNIRKNKALFQGLTLHFFLYFPGFYVVLLVLISRHGEIKKKRV